MKHTSPFLLVIFMILIFLGVDAAAETFKLSKNGKYEQVEIITFQKLHLTKSCMKGTSAKCMAFDAAAAKTKNTLFSKTSFIGHPASNYCKSKNGLSRILIGKENKQYDYCLFQDGSMIDSWDLYYKHYPK